MAKKRNDKDLKSFVESVKKKKFDLIDVEWYVDDVKKITKEMKMKIEKIVNFDNSHNKLSNDTLSLIETICDLLRLYQALSDMFVVVDPIRRFRNLCNEFYRMKNDYDSVDTVTKTHQVLTHERIFFNGCIKYANMNNQYETMTWLLHKAAQKEEIDLDAKALGLLGNVVEQMVPEENNNELDQS